MIKEVVFSFKVWSELFIKTPCYRIEQIGFTNSIVCPNKCSVGMLIFCKNNFLRAIKRSKVIKLKAKKFHLNLPALLRIVQSCFLKGFLFALIFGCYACRRKITRFPQILFPSLSLWYLLLIFRVEPYSIF